MTALLKAVKVVVVLTVAQVSCARSEQPLFSVTETGQFIKEFQDAHQKTIQKVQSRLGMNGENIVRNLRLFTSEAERAVHQSPREVNRTIKDIPILALLQNKTVTKIDEARKKLEHFNPEIAAGILKFNDTLNVLGKEAKKIEAEINKAGGMRDAMDNFLKNFINLGTQVAKEFNDNLNKAVEQAVSHVAPEEISEEESTSISSQPESFQEQNNAIE